MFKNRQKVGGQIDLMVALSDVAPLTWPFSSRTVFVQTNRVSRKWGLDCIQKFIFHTSCLATSSMVPTGSPKRILVMSVPLEGHIAPCLSLAHALCESGHFVTVYSTHAMKGKVAGRAPLAEFLGCEAPWDEAFEVG